MLVESDVKPVLSSAEKRNQQLTFSVPGVTSPNATLGWNMRSKTAVSSIP
jgi:hypothetical protein